jgi:hypothetical protein
MTPRIGANPQEGIVIIDWIIKISVFETKEQVASINTEFRFEVEELDKFVKQESGEFNLNTQFLKILTGVSLSTMRGIILEKCSGSLIIKEVMPIVNPDIFFVDDTNKKKKVLEKEKK